MKWWTQCLKVLSVSDAVTLDNKTFQAGGAVTNNVWSLSIEGQVVATRDFTNTEYRWQLHGTAHKDIRIWWRTVQSTQRHTKSDRWRSVEPCTWRDVCVQSSVESWPQRQWTNIHTAYSGSPRRTHCPSSTSRCTLHLDHRQQFTTLTTQLTVVAHDGPTVRRQRLDVLCT